MNTRTKRTRDIVYDCIVDLCENEQYATTKTVATVTGLKKSVVDDHCDKMVAEEVLRRPVHGCLAPMDQHPPSRPVTQSVLLGGLIKLEIGDEMILLTPKESRTLGVIFSGYAHNFSNIQIAAEFNALNAIAEQAMLENRRLAAKLAELSEATAQGKQA